MMAALVHLFLPPSLWGSVPQPASVWLLQNYNSQQTLWTRKTLDTSPMASTGAHLWYEPTFPVDLFVLCAFLHPRGGTRESSLSSRGELICIYFPWSIVSLHTTSESLQWELESPSPNLRKRSKGHLRTTTHTRITYIDTYKRHGRLVTLIVAVLTTGH